MGIPDTDDKDSDGSDSVKSQMGDSDEDDTKTKSEGIPVNQRVIYSDKVGDLTADQVVIEKEYLYQT